MKSIKTTEELRQQLYEIMQNYEMGCIGNNVMLNMVMDCYDRAGLPSRSLWKRIDNALAELADDVVAEIELATCDLDD